MLRPAINSGSAETLRLQAEDLSCLRGGRLIFAGLSFCLDAGEALVLSGPNGSGKSSLLRLVAGLVPAYGGTLDWTGGAGSISYLGHQEAVKPAMTVRETLRFWAAVAGARPDDSAIEVALAAVGLDELGNLSCRYLSAGQRRRLALARFEFCCGGLWLLDEPTLGLDAAAVARLETRLARHQAEGGLLMLATHVPLTLSATRRLALEHFATSEEASL
jgi:heme exporter protein A